MLVLTRKLNESIIINGNIEIKVVEIEDGRVRVGIEAPREIEILRKELYDSVGEENRESAKGNINLKEFIKNRK